MANCPKCQADLQQDSGFVLCPSCGHPSVISIEGNSSEPQEPSVRSVPQPPPQEPTAFQIPGHTEDDDEPAIASLDFANQEQKPEASNFGLFGNEAPSHNEPGPQAPKGSDSINISDYANSEFSQGKNGAFVYNVSISDIDSKEIREFLREAINDTRFNWDSQTIISQIKKGELLLKNLSPVKASILINRIKRLPVKIRWEQYAITQADQDLTTL